jgi:hypothetical protein
VTTRISSSTIRIATFAAIARLFRKSMVYQRHQVAPSGHAPRIPLPSWRVLVPASSSTSAANCSVPRHATDDDPGIMGSATVDRWIGTICAELGSGPRQGCLVPRADGRPRIRGRFARQVGDV